jgi:hypothetical protein
MGLYVQSVCIHRRYDKLNISRGPLRDTQISEAVNFNKQHGCVHISLYHSDTITLT